APSSGRAKPNDGAPSAATASGNALVTARTIEGLAAAYSTMPPALSNHVGRVVLSATKKQVFYVAAIRHVAAMKYPKAVRDRTTSQLPRKSVRSLRKSAIG